MNESTATGIYKRRQRDLPILVVSQDYELFFGESGSIEKCLIEPCDYLLEFARKKDVRVTFFVDAGMLCCMKRIARTDPMIGSMLTTVKRHIESLVSSGHEVGLHIHPHWEETVWKNDRWSFAGTRYRLRDFSHEEVAEIFESYTSALQELTDGQIKCYRAGGFCVEPFGRIRDQLLRHGITIDSSVVPGAVLKDKDKGFDFGRISDRGWWRFRESPTTPDPEGDFLEIAVTPLKLPLFHYWGRLADRTMKRSAIKMFGDGSSKTLGNSEILRRLTGRGRVSELSLDAPKARRLVSASVSRRNREVWQVMGHPKLLGPSSLEMLSQFMDCLGVNRSDTLTDVAAAIRAGYLNEK